MSRAAHSLLRRARDQAEPAALSLGREILELRWPADEDRCPECGCDAEGDTCGQCINSRRGGRHTQRGVSACGRALAAKAQHMDARGFNDELRRWAALRLRGLLPQLFVQALKNTIAARPGAGLVVYDFLLDMKGELEAGAAYDAVDEVPAIAASKGGLLTEGTATASMTGGLVQVRSI